jgi:hypothetical protein
MAQLSFLTFHKFPDILGECGGVYSAICSECSLMALKFTASLARITSCRNLREFVPCGFKQIKSGKYISVKLIKIIHKKQHEIASAVGSLQECACIISVCV